MSGTANLLMSHFDHLPASQRLKIDGMIGASGGPQMLRAANQTMQDDYLGNVSALSGVSTIIEITKKIIENFVELPSGLEKLLEKIDLILDGIGKLLPGVPSTPRLTSHVSSLSTVSVAEKVVLRVEETKTLHQSKKITGLGTFPTNQTIVAIGYGQPATPNDVSIRGEQAGGPITIRLTYDDGTTGDIRVTVGN